jgi:hypothetical protein
MTDTANQPDVVACSGREYRLRRGAFAVLLIVMGLWFALDGFVRWPAEQEQFSKATPEQQARMTKPHNDASILIQQLLAVSLTPLGLILLPYFLYMSRGECRLSQNTLYLPGHPPIPLQNVLELDKSKWDRKGIASIRYAVDGTSASCSAVLDDFAYEQNPIHEIVKRIEEHLQGPADAQSAPQQM